MRNTSFSMQNESEYFSSGFKRPNCYSSGFDKCNPNQSTKLNTKTKLPLT